MKITIFDEIIDEREPWKVVHDLYDILILSLCAIICGAEDYKAIEDYGIQKKDFLKQFLNLQNGIPSESTIKRTFRYLDPKVLAACLQRNISQVLELQEKYLLNIDGKVLRGTNKKGKKNSGICILTAWAQEQNLVIGQFKADEKSNEKTAIPELIKILDLTNAIVSIDAIACTNTIAKPIIDGGGDYIIAVKNNKKGLKEEITDWLDRDRSDFDVFQKTDTVGGRIEQQKYTVCTDLQHLCQEDLLYKSKSIIKVWSKRTIGEIIQEETRYYTSSLCESAENFAQLIRGHWSIENQLHWHLDVSFNEDKNRVRKDNGAENMNVMRKLSLQCLKKMTDKTSVKGRRLKAGWKDDYLFQVLESSFS